MWNIEPITEHDFVDPWAHTHKMRSRVCQARQGPPGGWYVWLWDTNGAGWVYAGTDPEHAQRLLELKLSTFSQEK